MARTRSIHYGDQRDLILERAAALFASRGYVATSMNEVALACGLSKPALYHYFADKDTLLLEIASQHVNRLVATVRRIRDEHVLAGGGSEASSASEASEAANAAALLRELIVGLVAEYADAQSAHRVLTEDVRFLREADQQHVLDQQRAVVQVFAAAVARLRPDAQPAQLVKPLTMLLFGMVNWMFTWHRPDGALSHARLAPLVGDLFIAGVQALNLETPAAQPGPAAAAAARNSVQANPNPNPNPDPESDAQIELRIVELLQRRAPDRSICPSEVARSLANDEPVWRALMPQVRRVASALGREARIRITQGSEELPPDNLARLSQGAIRLRRGPRFDGGRA